MANNVAFWRRDRYLQDYRSRLLNPAEVLIFVRYGSHLSRRVLEIGCGAGRVLGYLAELAEQADGIDIAPSMVEYCRQSFPTARVRVGDLRGLGDCLNGRFNMIVAADNVLDVLDDGQRRKVLKELLEQHLAPGGLLAFCTHNLAAVDGLAAGASAGGASAGGASAGGASAGIMGLLRKALHSSPAAISRKIRRLPEQIANRRRLGPLQYRGRDHAVINDLAHEYGLLHYYIRRDDQERQLEAIGYRLLECRELGGATVARGQEGRGTSLYYVAAAR